MQYPAQVLQSIVNATAVAQNPLSPPAQRAEAVAFFEQLKRGDVHLLAQAASALLAPQYPFEVQVSALTLLNGLVKTRWQELSGNEQAQLAGISMQSLKSVGSMGEAGWPLRSKSALLLALVVRQQGPEGIAALSMPLQELADQGPVQAELACLTWHFVAEDLTQFEETGGEVKRKLLAALTNAIPNVLPFLIRMLEQHFQRAMSAVQVGDRAQATAHVSVLRAALGALSAFVEWAPMARIVALGVVPAASFFMRTEEFRLEALDILRQISSRKRGNDAMDAYVELMVSTCDALMATAAGLLAPESSALMDFQGPLEEFGLRLCRTLVAMAENHMRCFTDAAKRATLLQELLAFSRHPFLLLSWEPLGLWGKLLREAGEALTQAAAKAQPLQANGTSALPPPPPSDNTSAGVLAIPPELCQELLVVLGQQLLRVVHEDGVDFPPYFDDHQDFKDLCNRYRGAVKTAVRSTAQLYPRLALECCSQLLAATLQRCADAGTSVADRHSMMEAAVHYLEAVLPSLGEGPAASDAAMLPILEALLRQLMAMRIADPVILTLQGRGLETFARFLLQRPALALPLLEAVLELMQLMALPGPGQQPPPARLTPEIRDRLTARMNLAKVLLNMARVAPQAFAPQLESIVQRLQDLWQQGRLMEGERVNLAEGLLAATSALGVEVQSQALEWLLAPLATHWAEPGFLADCGTPAAFAARYMPLEVQAGGTVAVGGRESRWSLYHELAMLERSIRRTPVAPQSREAAASHPPPHPLTRHLSWMVPPVARILACVHGLWAPDMQAALAPASVAFQLDPIERALLLNEDRDVAKAKQSEEPASVAGASPGGLRHWLRGVRDSGYAVLGLLAAHCPTMWADGALATLLGAALVSSIEYMELRHLRMLLRHVILAWLSRCPASARPAWLLPLLPPLLRCTHLMLAGQWDALAAGAAGAPVQRESAAQAGEEVVRETMLRSASREHLAVLVKLTERTGQEERPPSPTGKAKDAGSAGGGEVAMGGTPPSSEEESILEMLLRLDPPTARVAVSSMVAALAWPDAESTRKAAAACRVVVALSHSHPELVELVCGDLLRSAVRSLTLVSSSMNHAEVVALIRAVLASHMAAARPMLLALPNITPQVLAGFESALAANGTEKSQRDVIKALLLEAGGDAMRALAATQPLGAVTSVPEPRGQQPRQSEDGEPLPDLFGAHDLF